MTDSIYDPRSIYSTQHASGTSATVGTIAPTSSKPVILASCSDAGGTKGGLYVLDVDQVRRLDSVATNSATSTGDLLARLLWSRPGGDASLVLYDQRGVVRYCRLDGDGDAHHVTFQADTLLVTSTSTNSILRLSMDLIVLDRWRAPGSGDSWHINGVHVSGDRQYASAFGRFPGHRKWKGLIAGSGIVFDLSSGEDILTGLSAPHHPQLVGHYWYVCNAGAYSFLVIDAFSRKHVAEVQLGGWTRGLVVTDDVLYVGVSAPRHERDLKQEHAEIVTICRRSFQILNRIELPAREIGDLALVDSELLQAI